MGTTARGYATQSGGVAPRTQFPIFGCCAAEDTGYGLGEEDGAVRRKTFVNDLRSPVAPIRRLLAVLAWELRWALRRHPRLFALMQFAAAARVLLQGGVVFLLRSGLSGPASGHGATIAFAILLLAASIAAGFVFRLSTNRLAVLFETDLAAAAVDMARTRHDPEALHRTVFPGSRFAGRSAGIAFIALTSAVSAFVLLIVALTLDVWLTVVVTALILPSLLIQLILNRRVHRNASDRRRKSGAARAALRVALSGAGSNGGAYVATTAYRDQRAGYERYIGTTAFADMTAGISIVLGVAFAAFWLFLRDGSAAGSALADGTSRAVAILLYLQAVGALLRYLASFTRLFGPAEAVYLFVTKGVVSSVAGEEDDDDEMTR